MPKYLPFIIRKRWEYYSYNYAGLPYHLSTLPVALPISNLPLPTMASCSQVSSVLFSLSILLKRQRLLLPSGIFPLSLCLSLLYPLLFHTQPSVTHKINSIAKLSSHGISVYLPPAVLSPTSTGICQVIHAPNT